jgi:hypothetical protein
MEKYSNGASTPNQALDAVIFLHKKVLKQD